MSYAFIDWDKDSGLYTLRTPYKAAFIEEFKQEVPPLGRFWEPKTRMWFFSEPYLDTVQELCLKHGFKPVLKAKPEEDPYAAANERMRREREERKRQRDEQARAEQQRRERAERDQQYRAYEHFSDDFFRDAWRQAYGGGRRGGRSHQQSYSAPSNEFVQFCELCGKAALKAAYRVASQRLHPDRPGGDAERMKQLNAVWQKIETMGSLAA